MILQGILPCSRIVPGLGSGIRDDIPICAIVILECILFGLVKLSVGTVLIAVLDHIPGTEDKLSEIVEVDAGHWKTTGPLASPKIVKVVLRYFGASLLAAECIDCPAVIVKEHASVNVVETDLVVAATAVDIAARLMPDLDS